MNAPTAFVVFGLIISGWNPFGQSHQESPKSQLSVLITTDKTVYRMTEAINLKIQLRNAGGQPLLVSRWLGWAPGHTELRVIDGGGRDVHTDFLADEVPPPPRESDFVKIEPGQSFKDGFKEGLTHLINIPGCYTLFLVYRSPVSEDWTQEFLHLPHIPLWSSERGLVLSNKIKITVKE